MTLLKVERLHISLRQQGVEVASDVDFCIEAGEILALVGASGSGKTLTGLALLGLLPAAATVSRGSIRFRGQELTSFSEKQWRTLRGKDIAMIFQDPLSTLNPVLRIDTQLLEALQAHRSIERRQAIPLIVRALEQVGISAPLERLLAYPHQLSGGMRQRVAIAMALINQPALIICDEATTALDVTVQSQVLHLLKDHCSSTGSSLLWISHDLAVVAGLADRIAVMQAGRIVEMGITHQILAAPAHAYTQALLHAVAGRETP